MLIGLTRLWGRSVSPAVEQLHAMDATYVYSSVNHPLCINLEVVYEFVANNAWILVQFGNTQPFILMHFLSAHESYVSLFFHLIVLITKNVLE